MKLLLLALAASLSIGQAGADEPSPSYVKFCAKKPIICATHDLREFFTLSHFWFDTAGLDANPGVFFGSFDDAALGRFFAGILEVSQNDPEQLESLVKWMSNVWMHAFYLNNTRSELSYLGEDERGLRKLFIRNFFDFQSKLDRSDWELILRYGDSSRAFLKISERFFDRTIEFKKVIAWMNSKRSESNTELTHFLDGLNRTQIEYLVSLAPEQETLRGLNELWADDQKLKGAPPLRWNLKKLFDEGFWQARVMGYLGFYPEQDEDLNLRVRVIFEPKLGRVQTVEGWIVRFEFGSMWIKTVQGPDLEINLGEDKIGALFVKDSVTRPKHATYAQFREQTLRFYQAQIGLRNCDLALTEELPQ